MPRLFQWLAPAIALAILAIFSNTWVAADDAPTSQPTQLGSITVKVVDQNNQIVTCARVQLAKPSTMPSTDPTADDTGGGGRRGGRRGGGGGRGRGLAAGPALASGLSDTDGSYTFKDIILGNYIVTASTTGQTRTRGREAVTLGSDGPATITVTLMPRANRGGGGGGAAGNNNGGGGGGGGGNGGG